MNVLTKDGATEMGEPITKQEPGQISTPPNLEPYPSRHSSSLTYIKPVLPPPLQESLSPPNPLTIVVGA